MSPTLTDRRANGPTRAAVRPAVSKVSRAEPSLLEQAERLRDAILRSKLSHPNPWHYTAKARIWAQRAQRVVDDIAAEQDRDTCEQALEALAAEVEGDADFQEARRLF